MIDYEQLRLQTSVRGAIIGYGIAAYAFLVPPAIVPEGSPFPLSGRTLLVIGLVLQLVLLGGRFAARQYDLAHRSSPEVAPVVVFVLELLADGVTVLLFALATYGPLVQFAV